LRRRKNHDANPPPWFFEPGLLVPLRVPRLGCARSVARKCDGGSLGGHRHRAGISGSWVGRERTGRGHTSSVRVGCPAPLTKKSIAAKSRGRKRQTVNFGPFCCVGVPLTGARPRPGVRRRAPPAKRPDRSPISSS
jgi:hypothetical protein